LERKLLENRAQPCLYTLEILNWLYFIYYAFLSNSATGKAFENPTLTSIGRGYYYDHNDSLIGIFIQDKTIVTGPFTMDLHSPPPQKAKRP
jgi:hypothetical protein